MSNLIFPLSMVWLVSEIVLGRVKHSKATDQSRERTSLRVLWITIAVCITAGVMIGTQEVGVISEESNGITMLGLAMMVTGIVFRWVAILSLGKAFTVDVAIREDHQLVQHGIYKFLRHPSYTGSLLTFLGFGVGFANYLSIVVIFFPILFAFLYRIHVEEKTLIAKFGDEYLRYRARTKALIPGIW